VGGVINKLTKTIVKSTQAQNENNNVIRDDKNGFIQQNQRHHCKSTILIRLSLR